MNSHLSRVGYKPCAMGVISKRRDAQINAVDNMYELDKGGCKGDKGIRKKRKGKKKGGDIKRTELVGDCDGTIPVDHGRLEKRKER